MAKHLSCYLGILVLVFSSISAQASSEATTTSIESAYIDSARSLLYINPDSSLILGRKALVGFWQRAEYNGVFSALSVIGNAHLVNRHMDLGFNVYKWSLKLAEFLSDKRLIAQAYGNLGIYYQWSYMPDSALYYYRAAMELQKELDLRHDVVKTYVNLATVDEQGGRPLKALATYYDALEWMRDLDSIEDIAHTLYANIGEVYHTLGMYDSAFSFFTRSLSIREELGDPVFLGATYTPLGLINDELGETAQALEMHERALVMYQAVNDSIGIAVALNNMGKCHADLGNLDSAMTIHRDALRIRLQFPLLDQIAASYNNIGFVHEKSANYDSAATYHRMALNLQQQLPYPEDVAYTLIHLGNVLVKNGNGSAGINSILSGMQLADTAQNVDLSVEARVAMVDALEAAGSYRQALEYEKELRVLRDTIFNKRRAQSLSAIEVVYATAKKQDSIRIQQQQIAIQEGDIELRDTKIQNRDLIIALAGVGVAGLIFLTIFARRNARREKEYRERVVRTKKGLHHHVKGQLEIVVQFIETSRSRVDKPVAEELEKLQGRVTGIGDVHRHLYEQDNVTAIDLRTYLSTLCADLNESYSPSGVHIEANVSGREKLIGIKKAIPFSILLNEIITNSYKHAFTDGKSGLIKIGVRDTDHGGAFISVVDDGIGLSEDVDLNNKSYGMELIHDLAAQLNADLSFKNKNGTTVEIQLPKEVYDDEDIAR